MASTPENGAEGNFRSARERKDKTSESVSRVQMTSEKRADGPTKSTTTAPAGRITAPGSFSWALAESGTVDPKKLVERLHTTLLDLATTIGISRDSVTKRERVRSIRTQQRLREFMEILTRSMPWCGSLPAAYAWFRSQPLPEFGDRTAEFLVREGRAADVLAYLDHVASGGYA